jgi:hypothetical protein
VKETLNSERPIHHQSNNDCECSGKYGELKEIEKAVYSLPEIFKTALQESIYYQFPTNYCGKILQA